MIQESDYPDGVLDLQNPGDQVQIKDFTFTVAVDKTIQIEQPVRSELREANITAQKIYNDRAIRLTIEGPRARVMPSRFEMSPGPDVMREIGKLIFGDSVLAAEAKPVLPKNISTLPAFSNLLSSVSSKREILDVRSHVPENPAELDALLLYSVFHPDVNYRFIFTATPKAGDRFTVQVRDHFKAQYGFSIPANFKLDAVSEAKAVSEKVHQLLNQNAKGRVPAALISDNGELFAASKKGVGGIGYRANLLRVMGSAETLLQNAASLLAAERLLETLSVDFLIRVQQGRDLDRDHLWENLVADLRKLSAFSSAA